MMYPWFPHAICQECDYMLPAKKTVNGVFAFYHPTAEELPTNTKTTLVDKFRVCPQAGKWFSYPPLSEIDPPAKVPGEAHEVINGKL
jgi:hypothetical protein